MRAEHPCPSCRAQAEHEATKGERVQCQQCGSRLKFIPMFSDGNLILLGGLSDEDSE